MLIGRKWVEGYVLGVVAYPIIVYPHDMPRGHFRAAGMDQKTPAAVDDGEMVTRLRGYDFFRAIGSPQRIVAPMVRVSVSLWRRCGV